MKPKILPITEEESYQLTRLKGKGLNNRRLEAMIKSLVPRLQAHEIDEVITHLFTKEK